MKAIDLFCGPGGLSLGLRRSGIEPELCVEFNKDAITTYAGHHAECLHLNKDVREIGFTPYRGRIDIVVGGPPCQPFSSGGLRRGMNDKRDMIPEFIRCLAEVQPEAFLMENVPGLLTKQARPYFETALAKLSGLGYKLNWGTLLAADYGVPQKRRRLFVLGCRSKFLLFPRPTHGPNTSQNHPRSKDFLTDAPMGIPPKSPVKYAKMPDLRKSPYAGHVYNGGGRPIDPDGPCHTILASSGGYKTHWIDTQGVAPEYHAHLMNGGQPREGIVPGARRLTIEECATIQSFPKSIEFSGSRSAQYTQIGDAVPPVLAEVIGKAIVTQLNHWKCNDDFLAMDPSLSITQKELLF